jgi:antitoxin component of MazEF toxin-antitoxin module
MAQKIIRIGSSLGVTIPKRLLEKLELTASDEVELNYNRRHESIDITAVKTKERQADSLYTEIKQLIDENQEEFAKLDE